METGLGQVAKLLPRCLCGVARVLRFSDGKVQQEDGQERDVEEFSEEDFGLKVTIKVQQRRVSREWRKRDGEA